jgi:hypothetical protein
VSKWQVVEPVIEASDVDGRARRNILQVSFGEPTIARVPEPEGPNTLRHSALDPGSTSVVAAELVRLLATPRLLDVAMGGGHLDDLRNQTSTEDLRARLLLTLAVLTDSDPRIQPVRV